MATSSILVLVVRRGTASSLIPSAVVVMAKLKEVNSATMETIYPETVVQDSVLQSVRNPVILAVSMP
jgi:hypothetical protein